MDWGCGWVWAYVDGTTTDSSVLFGLTEALDSLKHTLKKIEVIVENVGKTPYLVENNHYFKKYYDPITESSWIVWKWEHLYPQIEFFIQSRKYKYYPINMSFSPNQNTVRGSRRSDN